MTAENFDACFAAVAGQQWPYESPFGVDRNSIQRWFNRPMTNREIDHLDMDDMKLLYDKLVWRACRLDLLPEGIDLAIMSVAVEETRSPLSTGCKRP
jgi:lysozyme family protein